YYGLLPDEGIKSIFMGVFAVITAVSLFLYIDKINYEVAGFLNAILHDDYTNKYSGDEKGKSFGKMYAAFNMVNARLNQYSQREESQYLYLSTLVKQLQVGVLSYDKSGKIGLINTAMNDLLGLSHIVRIADLLRVNQELYEVIMQLTSGHTKLVNVSVAGQFRQLSVSASEFILREKYYKLISVKDITGEVEQVEMESWQKLISVLTHEIMNSVAPVTSLSDSLYRMIDQQKPADQAFHDRLLTGLEAIKNRSEGLMKFTRNYRELTRVPLPRIRTVDGRQFIEAIDRLFSATLPRQTELVVALPPEGFELSIDPDLMSQVLLNLLNNAKEAIEQHKQSFGVIKLNIKNNEFVTIAISDDGGGIADDLRDKIFIPFFTGKENGSGIGLSIVKQIVQLHGGKIEVESNNSGATFTLTLSK
ncbi:MAG: ATP-binding protein, partial [Cyclobacteriaceae bacterium]